jgi:sporulation protein YlmC with PRC-barrel domain
MSLMTGLAYSQDQTSQQQEQQGQSLQQQGQQGEQGASSSQQKAPVKFEKSTTLGGQQGLAMDPGQQQVMFIASELIGKNVSSPQGQNLGKLSEIIFSPQHGTFGVLDLGNQRQTAVPWQLVTAVTPQSIVVNTTQSALNNSPVLRGDRNFASFNDPQFTKQLFSYYKVQPQGMGSGGQSQSGQGQSQGSESQSSQSSGSQSGQSSQSQGSQSQSGQNQSTSPEE